MNIQPEIPRPAIKNRQTFFSYILISFMMVCFISILIKLVQQFLPGINLGFMLPLAFFVSLEALYTQRLIYRFIPFGSNWVLRLVVEWILLGVVLKALLYLTNPHLNIGQDLSRWQRSFITFFTAEFLFCITLVILVWLFSSQMGYVFLELEEDQDKLALEKQGTSIVDRVRVRAGLIGWIFFVGVSMLFITALLNLGVPQIPQFAQPIRVNTLILLIYFMLGFVLLTQTQISILRTRWFLQETKHQPAMYNRWMISAVILIAAAGLFAAFLPTRYSLGFLEFLQTALGFILYLLSWLQFLLLAPIIFIYSLIARLIGTGETAPAEPMETPQFTPPVETPTTAYPWLDTLKSIAFWIVFIGVIIFALRYYVMQRQEIIQVIRKFALIQWLKNAWKWLTAYTQKITGDLRQTAQSGLERLRRSVKIFPRIYPAILPILGKLPPREQILFSYLALLKWTGDQGFPRRQNYTPKQYELQMAQIIPETQESMKTITSLFIEARYSPHMIQKHQSETFQNASKSLQDVLQEYLQKNKTSETPKPKEMLLDKIDEEISLPVDEPQENDDVKRSDSKG